MDMRQTDVPFVLKILRKDFSIWRFVLSFVFQCQICDLFQNRIKHFNVFDGALFEPFLTSFSDLRFVLESASQVAKRRPVASVCRSQSNNGSIREDDFSFLHPKSKKQIDQLTTMYLSFPKWFVKDNFHRFNIHQDWNLQLHSPLLYCVTNSRLKILIKKFSSCKIFLFDDKVFFKLQSLPTAQ